MAIPDISSMANQSAQMPGASAAGHAAREVEIMLSANTGKYQKEMQKAADSTNQIVDALVKVEHAYEGAIRTIGMAQIGLGASMQATATGAIYSAVQFEESFARVAKTTGLQNQLGSLDQSGMGGRVSDMAAAFGFGSNELQQFETDIRSLSTQMPVAVQEFAHLADVAGMLGVESENLTQFAETAAQLGAGIGELGSEQAIAGLANLIGAFGDAESSVDNLGSSLAELANQTRGNASDMLQFSDRLAGTAVQVGMTSEEVLGLGAAISAIGVMPELGASALTQFFTQFSRAVQAGGDDLDRMADSMGMAANELEEMWREDGATQTLIRFLQVLNAQGEEATVTLDRLGMGGVNMTQVLGGLAAQLHEVTGAQNIANDAYADGVAVAELAEIRFDSVVSSLRTFRQSMGEMARSMGVGFLQPLQLFIDAGTGLVNIFNELPQPIRTTIGMIAGLGGAALTLTGVLTLLFAQFHIFIAALHMVVHLLPMAVNWLAAMGGSALTASTYLQVVVTQITNFVSKLTAGTQAGMGFFAMLGTMSRNVLGMMGRALGRVGAALKTVLGYITLHTWRDFKFMLTGIGTAAQMTAGRLRIMLPLLGKIGVILAALGGAYWAITEGTDAWSRATEEQTNRLYELADAAGLALSEIDQLDAAFEMGGGGGDIDLAIEASDLVNFLKELEESEAEEYLFLYRFQLLQGGSDPEMVQRHIEELAHLADVPIEFEYDLQAARHGDPFQDLHDSLDGVFDRLSQGIDRSDEGLLERFMTNLRSGTGLGDPTSPTEQAHWDEAIAQIGAMATDTGSQGQVALFAQVDRALEEAEMSGDMPTDVANYIREQIEDAGWFQELQGAEDDRGFFQRGIFSQRDRQSWFMDTHTGSSIAGMLPDSATEDMPHRSQLDLARALEDESMAQSPAIENLGRAVTDVTGQADDLGEALRNASRAEFAEITNQLWELQEEMNRTAAEAGNIGHEFESALAEAIHQMGQFENETEGRRFFEQFTDTYPQRAGFVNAIEDAQAELARLDDEGRGFGDTADMIRTTIEGWTDEYVKMQRMDLEQELNATPARQQVDLVLERLRELTNEPWDAQVRVEFEGILTQTMAQEEQQFRQAMGRYDQIIDQREEAVRSHGERVESMEEDHNRRITRMREDHARREQDMEDDNARRIEDMRDNHGRRLADMEENRQKAIEDAHDQHRRNLEDIAEAEEDALEQRIEQQASAFNILERFTARPSTSIGNALINMRAQNEAMEEMTETIAELRRMGLDDDLIEEMGFHDPGNFGAARRMLKGALADPSLINEINREWQERMKLSEAFVSETDESSIREDFDERRKDLQEALDDQISDINERHREQVDNANENLQRQIDNANENLQRQMENANENHQRQLDDANENFERQMEDTNENHKRQMKNFAEQLEELGEDSFESLDELLERASETGLERLEEWAQKIEELREEIADFEDEVRRQGSYDPMDPASIDREFGITYDWSPEDAGKQATIDWLKGWRSGENLLWSDFEKSASTGVESVMFEANREIDSGVDDGLSIMYGYTDQDGIWRPAEQEGKKGAGRMVGGIIGELQDGTRGIDDVMRDWTTSIESGLNPVLEAVGSDPLEITTTRGSSGGSPRPDVAMAEGGHLPDQARIQPPGTLVQWAEPETGGEAFIPLASSKRERSKKIWEKTGQLLGIDIERLDPHTLHESYAEGGVRGMDVPDMSGFGALGDVTEKAMQYVYDQLEDHMITASDYEQRLAFSGAGAGGLGIGVGWRAMWAALKDAFPGAALHSGYRPGAITATGNPSYHGMGRAIDVTPSVDIANWIRRNYMGPTREMIYSPMNQQQVHNGSDHYYATPITRAMHWDHVHWAMAMGDILSDEMKQGSDTVPAMLTPGEFVMQAKSVKEYGLEMMEAMNARQFADGGFVGSMPKTRGREPMGNGQADLVKAFTKALENASYGEKAEHNYGPITVESQDPREMERKLDQRRRLSNLTGGRSGN